MGPGLPYNIQNCGGCSGKGGADVGLWSKGSATWVGMGVGEQNIVLYVDDGLIMVRNPIWVHTILVVVVMIF